MASWSVSFSTLYGEGPIAVTIKRTETPERLETRTERAIAVPFTVPAHGEVEIATIIQSTLVQLPPGEYQLTFEHGRAPNEDMWAVLTFRPVEVLPSPTILVADPELDPPVVLVMHAEPA